MEQRKNPLKTLFESGGTSAAKPHRERVMGMINAFRAEVCAKMHDDHGEKFASFDKCKDFMNKACHPGKDKIMDGDKREVTSKKGYCKEYFSADKKAEEAADKEDKDAADKAAAEGDGKAEKSLGDAHGAVSADPLKVMDRLDEAVDGVRKADEDFRRKLKEKNAGADAGASEGANGAEGGDGGASEGAKGGKGGASQGAGASGGSGASAGAPAAGVAGAPAGAGAAPGAPAGAPAGASGATAGAPAGAGASGGAAAKKKGGGASGGAGAPAAAAGGAVAGAPGGAPAGAPGGAPGGPAYPADEAWYYKDGGKNLKSRLGHMDADLGLPTQGFTGKLVEHDDQKTYAADWESEYGDENDWKEVCRKHPDSPWCPKRYRSGTTVRSHLASLMLLLVPAVAAVF